MNNRFERFALRAKGTGEMVSLAVLAIAMTASAPAQAQAPAAGAQPASADAAAEAGAREIVVTGSSIRGVAPIGSNLVTIGRDQAAKIAAVNANELTNTLPAITQSGSAPVGENQFSYYSPSIHGIGGSASNTTLVIVDGMRMPGGGTQFGQTDPNIIPASALQRVEVLADGASSVYGSDAVAGVINYITRRSFKGLEVTGRYGIADSFRSMDTTGIIGTTWDTGGAYVAGSYSYQSPLHNNARSFISKGDYRDQGGRNLNGFACSPATIRTTASGTSVYLSPSATTLTPVITSPIDQVNAPCNLSIYGDSIQSNKRATTLARIYNTFGDRLTATLTLNYNYLRGRRALGPGTVTNVAAFGPNSGAGGQINPFYVAPAGQPGATTETVTWAALKPDNKYGVQSAGNDSFFAYGTLDYELSSRFSIKWSNAIGRSRSSLISRDAFCSSCAILAINGTNQIGGSLTTPSVPGTSTFVSTLPLTTANALDVWRPNLGQTSQAIINRLYGDASTTTHYNDFKQSRLEIQGSLFDLPAGPLRVAVGGEYYWLKQDIQTSNSANIGPTSFASIYLNFTYKRNVYSGYAEIVAPIVSEDMEIPLVRKFDVNISGRIDHYDDVGTTSNPKIAANWEVTEGFRIRGNYATGFVAPPLATIGLPELGYRRGGAGVTGFGTLNVPVALYPEVRGVPGCANVTTGTCTIGTNISPGIARSWGTGPDVTPMTGKSWSVGIDFSPTFLPQLRGSITLWDNKFRGGVDVPNINQSMFSSVLHNRLTVCPTGCTQQQIADFARLSSGGAITASLPQTVYFFVNNDLGNVINLQTQGIDANATLRIPAKDLGTFTLGASGSYYTKFNQDFGDTPYSLLSTSGYNVTFPSIRFRGRFQLGWEIGNFSIDAFLNHTGRYRNWSNTSVLPVTLNAAGYPNGGGDRVKANDLIDLHVEYKLTSIGQGATIYLDGKNVFDKDPPFYSGNTTGVAVGGQGYNGVVSNPIGRIISAGFRLAF